MTEFTPFWGTIGGIIIGLSAAFLLLFHGKIAGISGIANGLFTKNLSEFTWRSCFLLGLIVGPVIAAQFGHRLTEEITLSWASVVIGGFLVGVGVNLGNGCTSGHGICGIGRLSKRSIVSTILFMAVAVLTVYVRGTFKGGI